MVDGGSSDATLQLISQFVSVRVFSVTTAERASQMNFGARQAIGQQLLFLHADTAPGRDCIHLIDEQCTDPAVVGGSFCLRFDQWHWSYRLLAFFTCINSRIWTFGDQGIFIKKSIFQQIGGYAAIPILEDLDLQLRARKKGKFVKITSPLITSARRFRRNGIGKALLLNTAVLGGFFLGISPHRLYRWYRQNNAPY